MNRRQFLMDSIGVSVLGLSGCLGQGGKEEDTATTDENESDDDEGSVPAYNCPSYLHVDRTEDEDVEDDIVEFSDLSSRRQDEFKRSLKNGDAELKDTKGAWVDTSYVRYEGDLYSVAVAVC